MALSYEEYIGVPGLLDLMGYAKTLDEQQCRSLWAHGALYTALAERELRALDSLLARELSRSCCDDVLKRLNRCVVLSSLVLQACGITSRAQRRSVTPPVLPRLGTDSEHEVRWSCLGPLVLHLVAHLPKIRFAGEVTDFKRLARLMREHVDHLMDLTQHLEQLTYHLTWSPSQLAPSGEISAPSLDTTELLEQTFAMVARHHPQTTDPAHSTNDELTFVIAHRSMEAWFAFVAAALQQAILCLSDDPSAEQLGWAIDCLMNCTEVIALFQGMIGVPKTFTPADYFLFRHQLAGGSGKYSSQFRLIELRLGRRGPDYLWRIEDVLTNQVRAALEQPSLATCITRLLEARGIFAPEATATERAKAIAEQIYLPTEADTPHADLRELLETAVALEEAWNLYGFRHLAMVERMTGKQGSMIAPPAPQEAAPTHGTEPPVHRHSKPYLLDALSAGSIFADAWAARTYVTRRPAVPPVRVG